MNSTDKKIAEVLAKFDEPMAGNVWRVQGTAVIYHKTLERIAAQAKIAFDEPKIIRAERDEAVIQVTGRLGERVEWSIGEALIGTNYRVSGKQAAYVWAMAEKRAKDRVILKLIELSGDVYSEEEADEFKQGRPSSSGAEASVSDLPGESDDGRSSVDVLIGTINAAMSDAALTAITNAKGNIGLFNSASPEDQDRIAEAVEVKRASFARRAG